MKADTDLASTIKIVACVFVGICLFAAVAAVVLARAGWRPEAPALPPVEDTPASHAPIAADAIHRYKPEDYPRLYAKMGDDAFLYANTLMRGAAEKAATFEECDRVDAISISSKSTARMLQWFADCANGRRVRIQSQIKAGGNEFRAWVD
ncbi:hypothetical protein FHS96_004939 [Sphingomonas zeicaulis]|uniref:hypothetical protein n=1 Tax=Sphingomonas zeicaulis TaxID=1632740 RepID=UPI003D1B7937